MPTEYAKNAKYFFNGFINRKITIAMKLNINKNLEKQYRVFTVVWGVGVRLLYGLELSRLTIFRHLPRPKIQRISRLQSRFGHVYWIYGENKLFCMKYNELDKEMMIYKMPTHFS